MKRRIVCILAMAVAIAYCFLKSYEVTPSQATWSGWTHLAGPNNWVGNTFVANFDSICWADVFVGYKGASLTNTYDLNVYEYPDGVNPIAYAQGVPATQEHYWLKFNLTTVSGQKFTRGRTYVAKLTRPNDSINFYWSESVPGGPYQYGEMLVGGAPQANRDLCLRLTTSMRTVEGNYWGFNVGMPEPGYNDLVAAKADTAGVGMHRMGLAWDWMEPSRGQFNFERLDGDFAFYRGTLGCEILGLLMPCTKWASSRIEKIEVYEERVETTWTQNCAPRNLWHSTLPEDSNYWAKYVDTIVRHFDAAVGGGIHTYEIWNEPNDSCTEWIPGIAGWWRRPNVHYNLDPQGDGLWQLCSLYVKLCEVASEVIKSIPGHADDKVLIGSMHQVTQGERWLVPGKRWLSTCYAVAQSTGQGVFWDGVTIHPYQHTRWPHGEFHPDTFAVDAETLRAIMRRNEHYDADLWITEIGWITGTSQYCHGDTAVPERQANCLTEVFVSAKASEASPAGGYDRMCWYSFLDFGDRCGLVDSGHGLDPYRSKASLYASGQTRDALVGRWFNGRVVSGDPGIDTLTRMYEFESPANQEKLWVAWRTWPPSDQPGEPPEPPPVQVSLPARADTLQKACLAYNNDPPVNLVSSGTDGWLPLDLWTRPVLITEQSTVSRPDMVADSIRIRPPQPTAGQACTVYVWVHDHGTRALPNPPGGIQFLCNGEPLGWRAWADGTDQGGGSIMFMYVCQWLDPQHAGQALFSAVANPNEDFVELGMDDNAAYRRAFVFNMPQGQLDVFTGPFARSEVPLMMMHSVASWSADSMRMFQEAYSQDGELLSVDSTAWFPLTSGPMLETCWTFLHGPSRYRMLAQHKDSLGNSCAPFSSMQDTIVFDSVAPGCEVTVNNGERFISQPQVPVQTTLLDSTDAPFEMRFANGPLVPMVQNSSFEPGFGSWQFSAGGGYGSGLEMGEVVLSQEHETWVRQAIPCGAFPVGHLGRQYRLSADLMGLAKSYWGQLGWLEFGYIYLHSDTALHDTCYQWFAGTQLNGPMEARVGLNRAFCDFVLPEPNPDPNLVWHGGLVRLRCLILPPGASGTAWLDNCTISPFGQIPQTSWWQQFQPGYNWQLDPMVTGEHTVSVAYRDLAGNETWPAFEDTVVLDMQPPIVFLQSPPAGYYLSDTASLAGWAFDWPSPAGDTYFLSYRLDFRYPDSANWQPVDPDSVSYQSAPPDTTLGQGWLPRHLGYWNTTLVPDGPYLLRVVGTDSALNQSEYVTWAYVQNDTGTDDCASTSSSATSMGPGSVYLGTATGRLLHYSEDDLDSLGCITISDSLGDANITAMLSVGDDSVLAADVKNLCIHKLKKNGQGKRRFANYPGLIAAAAKDDDGNIWAIDQSRSLLAKVRSNGTLAFTRGGQSADSIERLKNPEGMAVSGELVYVSDTRNNRLAVWDTAGNFTRAIPLGFMPQAILVTDSGAIYTVNKAAGTILGLNAQGEQFYRIEKRNSNPHKHLVLSDDQHYLFTYQPATKELLKYQIQSNESMPGGGQQSGGNANLPKELTLLPPRPNPSNGRVTISYALPKAGNFSLRIFDVTGRVVKTLVRGLGHNPAAGTYQCVWNHDDDRGRQLATGIYFVRLDAEDGSKVRKVVVER